MVMVMVCEFDSNAYMTRPLPDRTLFPVTSGSGHWYGSGFQILNIIKFSPVMVNHNQ